MNVVFISHTADLGGGERSMLSLVGNICSVVNLRVILPRNGPMEEELKKLNINYSISSFRWWTVSRKMKRRHPQDSFKDHLKDAYNLKRIIISLKPDLIVTNTSVVCVGALIANMLHIPHLWHVRELGEKDHGFIFEFGFVFTAKFINDFSSYVIFNSYATNNEFSKYISNSKSIIIYNSITINPSSIDSSPSVTFNKTRSFKLIVAGTISKKKNQMDAIKAVKILIRKGLHLELMLLGNCTDENLIREIKTYIDKYHLNNKIHLVNFVPNPYPLFKQANVVICTSKNEAFGRTILEGMLLKKPIIATSKGGIIEIIEDNCNGLLYEPGKITELSEKIQLLYRDKALYTKLAYAGYYTATSKFSNNNYIGKFMNLLLSHNLHYTVPPLKWNKILHLN